MLQPLSTSLGVQGGGLGFEGISPSVGISLDTYWNVENNDPYYDHINIQANGVINHGNDLAGPVPASPVSVNIEDCEWHTFRIKWDPASYTLSTYFDGIFRLETKTDIVNTIFNKDPMVYWGFSAATGGSFNIQKFCTALNPGYEASLTNDEVCFGTPVLFKDSSVSFTTIKNYSWDFGDGTSSTEANPPPHNYAQPGIYQVKHSITAADGCESAVYTKNVTVANNPEIFLKVFDTCETFAPRIDISQKVDFGTITQWNWKLDGASFSTDEHPDFTKLPPGNHLMELTVATSAGCSSNVSSSNFKISNTPQVAIDAIDKGCIDIALNFNAEQTDKLTTINKWLWSFGDGSSSDQQNTQHLFLNPSSYQVTLSATASNGCVGSDTSIIVVNKAEANAGNDTIVLPNTVFQLQGSGGNDYTWSPANGLNSTSVSNPTGHVANDTRYFLTVKTIEGCVDTSSVQVTIFNGSAVFVPTAFTPNGDGINDLLKPYLVGIKTLYYFTIYNRWGQKIFSTNNKNAGWNGYFNGVPSTGNTFVWVLKAVDIIGKEYNLKGAFILIK